MYGHHSIAAKKLSAMPRPGFRGGGLILGPGTGTSDSIPAEVPEGTYILPEDTTRATGLAARALADVPVAVSSGEFEITPQQVQAIGAGVLDTLRSVTHMPVEVEDEQAEAGQEEPGEDREGYANGGQVMQGYRMDAAADPRSTVYGSSDPYAASNAARMMGLANSIGSRGVMELGRPPAPQPQTARNSFGDAAAATVDPTVTQLPQFRRQGYADGGLVTDEQRRQNMLAQIPTGGMTAPAADGSQNNPLNTEVGRNAMNTLAALPGVGPMARSARLVGQAAESLSAAPAIGAANAGLQAAKGAADVLKTVGVPAAGVGLGIPSGSLASQDRDVSSSFPPGQSRSLAAAAGTPIINSPTQRSLASEALAGPPLFASNSITRDGNSYSGPVNLSGDVSIRNPDGSLRAPASVSTLPSGGISAQSMGAADALAGRENNASLARLGLLGAGAPGFSGVIGQQGNGNMWTRTPDQQRQDAMTQLSSIDPRTAARGAGALNAMDAQAIQTSRNQGDLDVARLQNQGLMNRTLITERGNNTRAAISAEGQTLAAVIKARQDAAKDALKANKENVQQAKDTQDIFSIINEARPILGNATGSAVGAGFDKVAQGVGYTTDGAKATSQLQVLQGALISKMPKMSGPQSDKDVELYKQMAGQIGDPTTPREQRMAAMDTIEKLNMKYLPQAQNEAGLAQVPSGSWFRAPDGSIRRKP